MPYTLKQKLGALVLDVPRFAWWLHRSWIRIRNRDEAIALGPGGKGALCLWQWTTDLHVAKVFPLLGRRLMQRAIGDWPIEFADAPLAGTGDVQVSFVIGHRGTSRVPHLLATLRTVAAQRGVRVECIVVEQSERSELPALLPNWVRYVYTPVPASDMPYARSWAFNVGARAARGALLVFHDNDILVPSAYASTLWNRYMAGFHVINLKRFIFYLSRKHSATALSSNRLALAGVPDAIMQNAQAGGSIAVSRNAFFVLGGYDESFVGWGGEDNEFWERAQTLTLWPYGNLPMVHLWHAPQHGKYQLDSATIELHRRRSRIPSSARIAELVARNFGDSGCLDPPWAPTPCTIEPTLATDSARISVRRI